MHCETGANTLGAYCDSVSQTPQTTNTDGPAVDHLLAHATLFSEEAEATVCAGVALRGLGAKGLEAGTQEMDERIGSGRTGGRLALPPGLEPGGGGLFGSGVRLHRLPDGSKPGEQGAQTGAHGQATVVGAAHKMVFVREVEVPEDAMEEFSAIMGIQEVTVTGFDVNSEARVANLLRVRAGPVGGVIRLPERSVARGTDQLRRAPGGVMQAVARADIGFAESWLEHGLQGGDGCEQVGVRQGQLESTVPAA